MATNRIRIDLNGSNNNIVSLTLCVLSEICTAELARDLHQDVLKVIIFSRSASTTIQHISERKPFLLLLRLSREFQSIFLSFCLKYRPVLKRRVTVCC